MVLWKWMRRLLKWSIYAVVMVGMVVYVCNYIVDRNAKGAIYTSTDAVPHHKVGLLLGTSKFLKSGKVNLYYTFRIRAAVALYKAGKIDYILVSGDNGHTNYDEPTTFKEDLIKEGVPEDRIVLDFAGFRTLDSIVRAKEVFGQTSLTIISQQFHNERALYLAKNNDITAVGFNAKDVQGKASTKVKIREAFARVKLMLDVTFNKQPKFLGDPITIG